jgi:hypothetical protein
LNPRPLGLRRVYLAALSSLTALDDVCSDQRKREGPSDLVPDDLDGVCAELTACAGVFGT